MKTDSPISYIDQMNAYEFQVQPGTVKGKYNRATEFYKRYLYSLIDSIFIFTLPDGLPENYFRGMLFKYGKGAFVYTEKFGWIFQPYSITKYNLYYQPMEIRVRNWLINEEIIGRIGIDAEIVRIMDDYSGLDDLVTYYATKLAMCDGDIDVNLMNSKVAYLISVDDKKTADEVKAALDKIYKGEPFAAINNNSLGRDGLQVIFQNLKNTYLVNDILVSKRTILNEFLTRIGIRNTNYDKRERLTTEEVSENDDETEALIDVMFDTLSDCFDRVNKISGLNLSVKKRFEFKPKGGEENAPDADGNDEL